MQQELTPSDGGSEDWFGYSVDISGGYIIVGALRHDNTNGNDDQGKAYIFNYNYGSGVWEEQAILIAADGSGESGVNLGHFGGEH